MREVIVPLLARDTESSVGEIIASAQAYESGIARRRRSYSINREAPIVRRTLGFG